MKCSIALATHNKDTYLAKTLSSIRNQIVPFQYEIVVVSDGSTDNTLGVCRAFKVETYIELKNTRYRNPSVARNAAYRLCKGEIIIAQSDEVIHHTADTIEKLCYDLKDGEFHIATVYNYKDGKRQQIYTGIKNQRPFFFLGSLWRKDLYAVGGNDEEFVEPGYDDDFFAHCLLNGLKLGVKYRGDVVGYHQDHPRPTNLGDMVKVSRELFQKKVAEGQVVASGGSWKF